MTNQPNIFLSKARECGTTAWVNAQQDNPPKFGHCRGKRLKGEGLT